MMILEVHKKSTRVCELFNRGPEQFSFCGPRTPSYALERQTRLMQGTVFSSLDG